MTDSKHKVLKAQYGTVFSSQQGELVLEHLKKKYYVDSTTFNKDNTKEELFYREGQRSCILHILNMLKGS